MGSSSSKNITDCATFVSDVTVNSIINNTTSCQDTTTVTQDQNISVDNSGVLALETACINAGQSAASCAALVGSGVTVSGVSQDAAVTIGSQCSVDDTSNAKVQTDLTNNIMQKINSSSDDVGDALKSIATAAGGKNQSTTQLQTTVSNLITNTFTTNNTQSMINQMIAQQKQIISFKNTQAAAFSNINQSLKLQALYSLVAKNTTLQSAINSVDNSATQAATVASSALPGLWSTLQGFFTGLFGSMETSYIVSGVSVGLCVLCCCVVCVAFFAYGGNNTLQQGISTAGQAASSVGPLAALA